MSHNYLFTVNVTHEDRTWIAICDELGLVTEASSFHKLEKRVHDIAPELCQLNCDVHPDDMRLTFVQDRPSHSALMN